MHRRQRLSSRRAVYGSTCAICEAFPSQNQILPLHARAGAAFSHWSLFKGNGIARCCRYTDHTACSFELLLGGAADFVVDLEAGGLGQAIKIEEAPRLNRKNERALRKSAAFDLDSLVPRKAGDVVL